MEEHICTNCSNVYTDGFCNHCGQKTAHRITIKHIFHDIVHAFTHADKGIIHLFLQLFLKPGIVAREYIIEGKRKKYFNPFQYILILGSIAAFVAVNSHFMETTIAAVAQPGSSKRQMEFMRNIGSFQNKYYNFFILLQLPFLALGSFWVFRKYKFNYAEHLTLQTFITAQTTVVVMFTMIVVAITGRQAIAVGISMSVLSIVYQVYAFSQFYREKSFVGVLRALGAYLLGLLLFMLVMIIILSAVLVIVLSRNVK